MATSPSRWNTGTFWRPFQLNWSPRGCKARVTGAKMNPSVGVQWELRRAVARRDQSHALGFFLNPAPLTGPLPRRRFRFAESPFSLKETRVDGSKRRGQGLPGVGDGKAAGEPSRPKGRRMRGFPPFVKIVLRRPDSLPLAPPVLVVEHERHAHRDPKFSDFPLFDFDLLLGNPRARSEERRVGKECRSR